LDRACADGLDFTAQVGSRPIGILLGLQASRHPFLTPPYGSRWKGLITRPGPPVLSTIGTYAAASSKIARMTLTLAEWRRSLNGRSNSVSH
jgi:hypothetical protein